MPGRVRVTYRAKNVGVNPFHALGGVFVVSVNLDVVPPSFESGEEGNQDNSIVAVVYSETITSSNFSTGVTIKVDGVAATILSSVLQGDMRTVYYTLQTPWAASNSIVSLAYSDVAGDYADLAANQMGDITAQALVNDVGIHERYNDAPNSFHLAYL